MGLLLKSQTRVEELCMHTRTRADHPANPSFVQVCPGSYDNTIFAFPLIIYPIAAIAGPFPSVLNKAIPSTLHDRRPSGHADPYAIRSLSVDS